MNWQMIKGYTLAVIAGGLLAAGTILLFFQWANVSQLSLFGYSYDIMPEGSHYVGGVNTALLMLASAVGGIVALYLVRLLIRALRDITRGTSRQHEAQMAHRISELEKARPTAPPPAAAP